MPTPLTQFQVLLPTDTASQTAIATFLDTIGGLTPFVQSQADVYTGSTGAPVQYSSIYGNLTGPETTSALAALATLNAALVLAGDPVAFCTSHGVTSQP